MSRITLTLLLVTISCFQMTAFAQQWQRLGTDNYGVQYIDDSTIVVVGEYGKIIRSTDGGVRWIQQNAGVNATLFGVCFVNRTDGVVVGDSGIVRRTTNAGEKWEQCVVNGTVQATLLRVAFPTADIGVAVGADGTILRTSDAGATWQMVESGVTTLLSGLYFNNAMNGVAVGNEGTILGTSDGGTSWEKRESSTTRDLVAVDFADELHGIAVGVRQATVRTSDGGETWIAGNDSTPGTLLFAVRMFSADQAIGVGSGSKGRAVVITTDGGKSWSSSQTGVPTASAIILRDLSFVDTQHGIAVGNYGAIHHTTDGGATWTPLSYSPLIVPPDGGRFLTGVMFSSRDTGIVIADQGALGTCFRTTDRGVTWNYQQPEIGGLNSIYFFDAKQGVMTGDAWMVRTADAGFTWERYWPQMSPSSSHNGAMQFLDNEKGFLAADSTMYRSTDRGMSWEGSPVPSSTILGKTQFLTPLVGYVTTWHRPDVNLESYNKAYRTTDGGHTWRVVLERYGFSHLVEGLFFLDENNGFITIGPHYSFEGNSRIMHTTDGGNTWDSVWVGSHWRLLDITFLNERVGYAVGQNATMLTTTDGGHNWTQEYPWPPQPTDEAIELRKIYLLPDAKTVMVIGKGVIMRREFDKTFLSVEDDRAAAYQTDAGELLSLRIEPNPVHSSRMRIELTADGNLRGKIIEVRLFEWDPLESTCRHASLSIL